MPESTHYARELMIEIGIPTVEFAEMLGIRAARISDFKTGVAQSAAVEKAIVAGIYHVARIWDAFGFRVPLNELAQAESKLEFFGKLQNFNGLLNRKAALVEELARRAAESGR